MGRFAALLLLASVVLSTRSAAVADTSNRLGTVNFPVSCNANAQARFDTGMELLHSFWYDRSEEVFREVAVDDPNCAMAYWGIAMSRWHQLWEWPDANDVKVAAAAIAVAEKIGGKTDRERRFIAAIADFYRGYNPSTDLGGADRYTADMQALHKSYPTDRQVALFYALALIATAPSNDPTFAQNLKAGAILEPIFAAEPNDPAAAHYIIHAYDSPTLAWRALPAAREYARIAPAVPHALHIPSHTFTDLGLWEDSIASNVAALSAEHQDYPNTEALGTAHFDDFHGTKFLEYAYLQAGRERDAAALADKVAASGSVPDTVGDQFEYMLTLSWRLVGLGEWQAANDFSVPPAARSEVTQPVALAILHYVRGLGAVRIDDTAAATAELQKLTQLDDAAQAQNHRFIASYDTIEEDSLKAWIAQAEGHDASAITLLRTAAAQSKQVDSDTPPASVWPLEEQLGTMLSAQHRPADALSAFRQSLKVSPNRLQSLSGAAEAATEIGDRAAALGYYRAILASCPHADADDPAVVQAKSFVGQSSGASRRR